MLARAAGGRVAADIWQLISSGKLLAGRIELDSPNIVIARLGPTSFALASEIKLGGDDSSLETLTLDDLPAGKLAIRHAVVTMQNWNSALPQLALAGCQSGRAARRCGSVGACSTRSCPRLSAVR